eukprot:CAMPEP_0201477772 /NCGR_PEP_ID=MMETSP0151_2-20130828/2738_1 /ASSEMBLY_ACC=CAM_ASM_000257 /TAXON_ID=200890 /ORGANISM="Paramoeba atlantica, Strain 621/1 / CCAP 1560/9" /LENGTH=460 /DNA_ID=CAMNT_0047858605 /DNA_START=40 /DNA_END=1422 /DNA_ORIENTATION=+
MDWVEYMKDEVAVLREDKPHNLIEICDPVELVSFVGPEGEFVISEISDFGYIDPMQIKEDGSYEFFIQKTLPKTHPFKPCKAVGIDVKILGPEESRYRNRIYSARLTFVDGDLTQVGFRDLIEHFSLNDGLVANNPFYQLLQHISTQKKPIEAVLICLQKLLHSPLHPCDRCDQFYDIYSQHELQRNQLANLYKEKFALHKELFAEEVEFKESWFNPQFWEAIHSKCLPKIMKEESSGVFSFPMLSNQLCKMFVEELENYATSGLPKKRPNSMNNYGLILNEIGMGGFFTQFQQKILQQVATLLFPIEGNCLDDHHTFIVQYKQGEDLGLDMHVDDADVTCNICLGKEFSGAGLTFCGSFGHPHHRHQSLAYQHVVGNCVIHLGSRRHGADDIESGERLNLIIWNRSHTFRSSKLRTERKMLVEDGNPDGVCLSKTHDRDFQIQKDRIAFEKKEEASKTE